MQHMPAPVVGLNRAAALAMREGPEAGLQALEPLMENKALKGYHLAHAALADMHRQLGHQDAAAQAYTWLLYTSPSPRH